MEEARHFITPSELVGSLGGITIQAIYKAIKAYGIETVTTTSGRKLIPPLGMRKLLEERGFQYPRLNLAFQMLKGGVGKTSLCFSLAVRAAQYGAKVLAIDLDIQGNLTTSFNIDARNKPIWLNLVKDGEDIENAIVQVSENLHVIPSNLNNSILEVELTHSSQNLRDLVRDTIEPIHKNYDLVVFDCPPAINKTNTSAACASELIIIPVNPDPYSVDGLTQTEAELYRIQKIFKVQFEHKILWNKFDARERLASHYIHEIAKDVDIAQKLLPVVIRTDASLKNAVFDAKSIFELPRKTNIREDIDQFAKEILGINQWIETKHIK